jgi:hypothetical protein
MGDWRAMSMAILNGEAKLALGCGSVFKIESFSGGAKPEL